MDWKLRGARGEETPTGGIRAAAPAALVGVAAILAPFMLTEFNLYLLTTVLIYALIALGLNVLLGYSGQVSIGHAGFLAIGAYATAVGAERYDLPMLVLLVGAAVLTGAAGWLLGRPATRLTGHYLAVATLGFAIIVEKALFELPEITGGRNGMAVPMLEVLGVDLGQGINRYVFVVIVSGLVFLFTMGVLNSRVGRGWLALKGSPVAASSAGIDLARSRSNAFVFSAVLTGIAGALYASHVGYLSSEAFNLKLSLVFLIAVVVGGMGSVMGSILGAAFAVLVPHFLADYAQAQEVVFGLAIILVVLRLPRGLVQLAELGRKRDRGQGQVDSNDVSLEEWSAPTSWQRSGTDAAHFSAQNLSKAFAGVQALRDVSFDVPPGVAMGVMGPNGAGKTTLFNILSGFYRSDGGAVRFGDIDVTRLPANKRTEVGVARCFQEALLFEDLTALDNLLVGADARCAGGIFRHGVRARGARGVDRQLRDEAWSTLQLLGLTRRALTPARDLPFGERKLVDLGRALMSVPKVLLLDEPAAGMNSAETRRLLAVLQRVLNEINCSIVVIEHDMELLMGLADRIVVLDFGEQIAEGTPAEVRKNPKVIEAYLGEPAEIDGGISRVAD